MLGLKTKKELANESHKLAVGSQLVRYRNITYIPEDFEQPDRSTIPDPERTVWIPLTRSDIMQIAADSYDTLFGSESELSSFDFMVAQSSRQHRAQPDCLLVRTDEGLRRLGPDGLLTEPSGVFVPNTLKPMLNENVDDKARVFKTVVDWLDSEEEAHALLHHLATALAPHWSAVKYILLLGEGRNGKSLLLKMVQAVFGVENASNVTRQDIASESPTVIELNGKLLNIVYDGQASYLKDSGHEKSLIAGEPVPVRRLYESTPTVVQTNALFIEGPNREPKSSDKSAALQKRLVRFQFPNVYALNHKFERLMLSPDSLGAFLSLLIDHYVADDKVAELLAPTTKAVELQLEHMFVNSTALQFIKMLEDKDPLGSEVLIGMQIEELHGRFNAWRLSENDLTTWAEPDVQALFTPLVNSERLSKRVDGKPRKVRVITSFKTEATSFIETLKEVEDDDDIEALVAD